MYRGIAFIPARSGSKRLKDKNVKLLDGHPLLAYSISAAKKSGAFEKVICATDSIAYAETAIRYGAEVPALRPSSISDDTSTDIQWVDFMLCEIQKIQPLFDFFSILRPTSPFRSEKSIIEAVELLLTNKWADSVRAVQKCDEHPGKMWVIKNHLMMPLLPFEIDGVPWHSNQSSKLPEIYKQTASLEVAWVKTAMKQKSISGTKIIPFVTHEYEGFDINTHLDWLVAEKLLEAGLAKLPQVSC